MSNTVVNALSFDIEDWFHMMEVDGLDDTSKWPSLPSIAEEQTLRILQILDEAGAKATFFVLGWVAERIPGLVKTIAASGHEIASHGYWHRTVYESTQEEFREDVRRSIELLEDQSGQKVRGYRAPSFSIKPGSEWAFDILLDEGIEYDASLFPARRGHGGFPCERGPHLAHLAPSGRPLPELPMSILLLPGMKLGFSGGGYLRLLPWAAIRRGFHQYHRRGMPVVTYLHPQDFAPDGPTAPMSLRRRFMTRVGRRTTEHKLRRLLREYSFDTCAAVVEATVAR